LIRGIDRLARDSTADVADMRGSGAARPALPLGSPAPAGCQALAMQSTRPSH